jgi:lipopolysaccharide transport system ATP-binding protein
MNNVVINIVDLCKTYNLGAIGGQTLSHELSSWMARVLKKEDPNLKIGAESYDKGQKLKSLDHINLIIQEGDTVGIIGSNGSGKSTLLKILSRVTAPTSGCIYVKGRIASLLEVGTGFHPELTGRENTYLNGAILGMTRKEIDEKLQDIIEFAEIERFIDTPVKRYSSGMYVRLAFAVAAHLEPDILVVDEVLAVGDYQFQQKCLGKMGDISKSGRTVLFVSHQLSMIRALCNKCVLLDHGRVVKYGGTEEVIDQYINQKASTDLVCHVEYENNPSLEQAQVSRLSLKNQSGEDSTDYEIFEPIRLEVEYVIKKPLVGVALGFSLYKNQGTVCQSFDTDVNFNLLNKREPGRYIATVDIPAILKAGNYVIDFTICRPCLDDIDYKKNALTFTVDEKVIDTSMCSYSTQRDGQFAARQQWNYNRLDS